MQTRLTVSRQGLRHTNSRVSGLIVYAWSADAVFEATVSSYVRVVYPAVLRYPVRREPPAAYPPRDLIVREALIDAEL
jgi:hypothetical protein